MLRIKGHRFATRLIQVTVAAVAMVGLAAVSSAQAQVCPNQITACGCKITSPGYYLITQSLINSGSGVCVDIQAANTVLEFGSTRAGRPVSMTGSGAGTGVLIESSAQYSVVAGIQQGPGAPAGLLGRLLSAAPPINLNEASIERFTYAIEDDADNTIVEEFNKLNLNNYGVYLNNVTNVTAGNFCADLNTVAGVLAVGTKGSRIYDFTAEKNSVDGLLMEGSSGNSMYNLTAVYNAQDGLLIQDSSSNSVSPASVGSNGANGIHIGCGSSPIACTGTSNQNHVSIVAAEGISTADVTNCDGPQSRPTQQPVGIHIEEGNSQNIIASNKATVNKKFDLEDDNADCDSNVWTNNLHTPFVGHITPLCTGNP